MFKPSDMNDIELVVDYLLMGAMGILFLGLLIIGILFLHKE